jgi:hypothetical protein
VSGVGDGEQKKTYRVIVRLRQNSNNVFGPKVQSKGTHNIDELGMKLFRGDGLNTVMEGSALPKGSQ